MYDAILGLNLSAETYVEPPNPTAVGKQKGKHES